MRGLQVPERYQLPLVIGTSVLVVLLVVGAVLVSGRLAPEPLPSTAAPSVATPPTASPFTTGSSSVPADTPEAAVRAFFDAYAKARRTDDPTLIRPHVTNERSSAYQSVEGFLLGQKEAGKASILTVQRLEDISVDSGPSTAVVHLSYTEGGYDISLETGEPLESPGVLAPRAVTLELRLSDGRWLVDRYDAATEIP